MRLPINIEELLGGRAVEGDRIGYKTGWNHPTDKIMCHKVCVNIIPLSEK